MYNFLIVNFKVEKKWIITVIIKLDYDVDVYDNQCRFTIFLLFMN